MSAASALMTAPEGAVPSIVSVDRFCAGMRLFAAGCTVITAAQGGERAGLTATAMSSVTADPPRLLVCVNRKVRAHALIVGSGAFAVNVLSMTQEMVARRFAGMIDGVAGEDRFLGADWTAGVSGSPVLADTLVTFDCRVVETIEASSHSIFIGAVVDIGTGASAGEPDPLVYFGGRFGGFA